MLDCLLKNGLVADGSGCVPVESNIGIKGDIIAYVGNDEPSAGQVIDVSGLVVSPGFIDTHAHSEFTILADGRAECKLSQGVTTEINGNCGLSAAPLYGDAFDRRQADLNELGITERWHTFDEYFGILQHKGIALNFATLCGHGNIRGSVIGYRDSAPSADDLDRMRKHLSEAVDAGAIGFSTGLIYPPGVYSHTDELVELSKVLSGSGGIYASHMRSEGDSLIESIEEVVRIGREAGVNVHVSHVKTAGERNWWKIDSVLGLMENVRNSGMRLTCDRYPYIASSTDLDTVLPAWVYEGGFDDELRRLQDPSTVKRIRSEISSNNDAYWKGVYVSSTINPQNKWMEGENIFDIAMKTGRRPEDALIEILIDEKVRTGAIFFSMSEDNLKRFLSLPYAMVGSDSSVRSFSGVTCSGKPHPRGTGSFARILGKYAREEKLFSLSEAVRKMTSFSAEIFGLRNRGLLKSGFYADIVVFDYAKIKDRATFKAPFQKAEGIAHVFVNGVHALKHGEFTGARAGRILK